MKTPKLKTEYAGLPLQGSQQRISRATGRREWWLSFFCGCGQMFATTLSVANQSNAKQRPLRCQKCQKTARVVREQRRQRKPEEPRTHTFSGDYRPEITPAAIKMLRDAKKKNPNYKRILQIVAGSASGSLSARIVPEWERIVVEAIELAAMEACGTQMPGDWTRETIREGLSVVRYGQYSALPNENGRPACNR